MIVEENCVDLQLANLFNLTKYSQSNDLAKYTEFTITDTIP